MRVFCLYLITISVLIFIISCTTGRSSAAGYNPATPEQTGNASGDVEGPLPEDSGAGDGTAEETAGEEGAAEDLRPTGEIPVEELVGMARQNVPERFLFVCDRDSTPLALYQDLDYNGLEDIFFLLIESPESISASTPKSTEERDENLIREDRISTEFIADMARLFSEESVPYNYYLALFLRTGEGLLSMYRIPLGGWYVFEGIEGFPLGEESDMPFCVSIGFQTHEGQEKQWIIFSRYNKFSFFTLKDSISLSMETRDIDQDGVLDIVEWRKVFEEGTGYETFLTWYKWEEEKYIQYDSTNIVRNLNRFMQKSGYLLSSGKWQQALRYILPADRYGEGMIAETPETLFLELFPPRSSDDSEGLDEEKLHELFSSNERLFNTVIFPQVLENPFGAGNGTCCTGYQTRFSVRFVLRDGSSQVRECSVRLNSNPFAPQQFYLEPSGESRQDSGE